MNKRLTISVCLLIIMILSTGLASFAYFTSLGNADMSTKHELSSANYLSYYTDASAPINLFISNDVMKPGETSSTVPAVKSTTDKALSLTISTGSSGGKYVCEYDIYYVPEVVYTTSSANVNNLKEYTISGFSDKGHLIPETSLNSVDKDKLLLENATIYVSGIDKKVIENYTFEVAFYNQDFEQSDNMGKKFGGQVKLVLDEKCEEPM